ncbi:MAG: peptidoglycan-binding protein [Candidatus Moranbacteria bacterium]|nr:peptidoglycan-binding protein [Candidatus Moranbacteria bacterium]
MFKNILKLLFILTVAIVGFRVEASGCDFTRDLKLGDEGEDVRCLQQYLNASGVEIALSGAGSQGKETTFFKEKTKEAVSLWQLKNNITPAEGYFGAKSRAKYNSLISGSTTSSSSSASSSSTTTAQYSATIIDLNNQISTLKQELINAKNSTSSFTGDQKKAADKIKSAIEMIGNAEDSIEDASGSTKDEEADIDEAKSDLFDAVNYFFKNNYTKALDLADDVYGTAEDIYDNLGGGDKSDAKEAIDDLKAAIDDAKDDIAEAEDDDEDVDDANDLIDEAYDTYKDAKTAYNDEDYEEAMDLADEAMDLVDEALDTL